MGMLNDSPARIVRQLLQDQGIGSQGDTRLGPLGPWPVYDWKEPSSPDNCITVYDTEGKDDGRTMIDGEVLDHYGLQFRVRAMDKPTGSQKARQLRNFLAQGLAPGFQNTFWPVTVSPSEGEGIPAQYVVNAFSLIRQVIYIGTDGGNTKRALFTVNCYVSINEVA